MMQFGTLPHDLTVKSMELFARKVMPRLRHIGEEPRQRGFTRPSDGLLWDGLTPHLMRGNPSIFARIVDGFRRAAP